MRTLTSQGEICRLFFSVLRMTAERTARFAPASAEAAAGQAEPRARAPGPSQNSRLSSSRRERRRSRTSASHYLCRRRARRSADHLAAAAAFIALAVGSLFVGVASRMPVTEIPRAFQQGIGDTLGFIAMVIGLGTVSASSSPNRAERSWCRLRSFVRSASGVSIGR